MILLEVRYLLAAVTLSEDLNFTQAAKRLKLSQSALSRQIGELERKLQVTLFHRDHARVEMTDAGRAFVEEARLSLQHNERAVQAAKAATEGIEASLTIGRSPYAAPILTSTLLAIHLPLYPRLHINLHSDFAPELVHGLIVGQLDLALIANPGSNRKITSTMVSEAPFYIALPDDHPLASKGSVTLRDVGGEPWILFERKAHPTLHESILRRAREEGINVRGTQSILSAEEAHQLVCERVGLAFLSMAGAQRIAKNGVIVRPLADKELRIEVCLASRAENRSKLVSEFARAFMKRISHVLNPPQMMLPIREDSAQDKPK